MLGSELYTASTSFLGGNPMDETLFYQLLNMAKNQREMVRDWVKLRTIDTSKVFTSADDYTSTKALPDRFLRTYGFYDSYGNLAGPYLVTSEGSKLPLKPIKLAERYDYRNIEGYYYLDLANNAIGRTGNTAGTLHLPFLQGTTDINEDTSWELLPDAFEQAALLLVYDVTVENKGSIDWDRINASQIPFSMAKMRQLELNLATWDARLQQAELGV